ncbi:MAG: hypothetical protein FJ143_06510, partial [Deltaproteobacteria bacterium]|nr:hypothetical protein [Deltaproteobacteria bacterium]
AAIHLEGLQKTTDLLVARRHKIDHLSAGTVYGMIAVVLVIIFKIRAIEVMGETRSIHLLLAPALARWALVVFLYGPNLESEDLAWRVAKQVTAWHLFVATAVTLAITIYLTGRAGLWVGLTISIVALLFRAYCQRQVSEISHHRFGALIEVSETLSLVLFASL